MRNLFIFVLIVIMSVFAGGRVDADEAKQRQCVYTWENVGGPTTVAMNTKTWKVTATFNVSASGRLSLVSEYTSNPSCSDCAAGDGFVLFDAVDVTLFGGKCPNLLLYPNGLGYTIYEDREACQNSEGKNNWCKDNLYEKTDVISEGVACSEKEKSDYNRNYESTLHELQDLFSNTSTNVNQISLASVSDIEPAKQEFATIVQNFTNSAESIMNKFTITQTCTDVVEQFNNIMPLWENQYINSNNENSKISDLKKLFNSRLDTLLQQNPSYGQQIEDAKDFADTTISNSSNDLKEQFAGIKDKVLSNAMYGYEIDLECGALLGDLKNIIQEIFNIIKIAAPILLIFFGSLDFGKAAISGDDKAMKNAVSDFGKRVIAAVAIFFLPWLINLLFHLPGLESLGISVAEDVLCNIGKVMIK